MKLAIKNLNNQFVATNEQITIIENENCIILKCGLSSLELHSDGTILLSGRRILQRGKESLKLKSPQIEIN